MTPINTNITPAQAAAPDLLNALEFLLADYIAIDGPELTRSNEPLNRALAAIAKAGKPPTRRNSGESE